MTWRRTIILRTGYAPTYARFAVENLTLFSFARSLVERTTVEMRTFVAFRYR